MNFPARKIAGIRRVIKNARSVAVSGHMNPDGDSIGSVLGLGLALRRMGKKVYMLCQDEIPRNYRGLPGAKELLKTTDKKVDLAIAVDCSIMDLLDKNIPVFKRATHVMEIDHHEFRRPFGDIQLIDRGACAVGEMIYRLLKRLNFKITRPVAENLLASVIVETNLFKLSRIEPRIFRMCAELVETGIDFSGLVNKVYGPRTKEAVMLSAICMLRARFLKNGRIVWSILKNSDMDKVRARPYDADAVANEMNSIKGVEIAVLFREKGKKLLRVGLRSKSDVNIGALAERYDGGGHRDIAGCYIRNDKRSIERILSSSEALLG